LTLAAGAIAATQAMAVDLYVDGSTAFRQSAFLACQKLYDTNSGNFQLTIGSTAYGNSTNATQSKNTLWCMTGTVSNTITALGATPLTIHACFNGSVQGISSLKNSTKLVFVDINGNPVTNAPTMCFSDVNYGSTPYPLATATFGEENVAVQPFVFVKSTAAGMSSITNISWEQAKSIQNPGVIPLSAWTYNTNDLNTSIYLINRTKDSGTRLTFQKELSLTYQSPATIWLWDGTSTFTNPASLSIIGSAGFNNANLSALWGSGYVGGGDIANQINNNNAGNTCIGYLSFADAKISGLPNWQQVISYNGTWPTAQGVNIHGNSGTNDFSPVTLGQYPFWAYEVIDYIKDPQGYDSVNQNITAAQMGNQATAGTIIGVLNHQTLISGGSPTAGSIENEIESTKVGGATAIRLNEMHASRGSVGGVITP
jgi:hypothetical protein